MNCKPGDLATVIHDTIDGRPLAGRLVEVLFAAPSERFDLPNGHGHTACSPGTWVCKSLGSPFPTVTTDGGTRDRMYGVFPDFVLRPLPGESDDSEDSVWRPSEIEQGEPA